MKATVGAMMLQTMDYGHTMAKSLIFATQIQIPIPSKYLRFEYKGLVFCRNNGWLLEKTDKGTKLVMDKSAKNTPNAPKFICPNCLQKAQKFGISMKKGFIGRP